MTNLEATKHYGINPLAAHLKWQVRVPMTRPATYPIYENKRDDSPHREGTAAEFNANPNNTTAIQATEETVTVQKLIGYGSTKEKALEMARNAI